MAQRVPLHPRVGELSGTRSAFAGRGSYANAGPSRSRSPPRARTVRFTTEEDEEAELGFELQDFAHEEESFLPFTRVARPTRGKTFRFAAKFGLLTLCIWGLFLLISIPDYSLPDGPLPPPYTYEELTPQDLVDSLYARQSKHIAQARSRYSLRNAVSKSPPPGYDAWFTFAQEHKCLVDDYEQVHHDFEPFYQLEVADPGWFKRMMKKIEGPSLKWVKIRSGKVRIEEKFPYDEEWKAVLDRARILTWSSSS